DGVIGRGATSIVCSAVCLADATRVAVKVLVPMSPELVDASLADRFEFEAQVLERVGHPNLVAVLEHGAAEDGLLYTVMELLEGETLRDVLAARGRLEAGSAVRIACSIAEGLQALHDHGLLHRDVKPANVFVGYDATGDGLVKLMDLGLARALRPVEVELEAPGDDSPNGDGHGPPSDVRPRRQMATEDGMIVGSGPYMSPEQIQGGELDARSDVYALGVVTYRMLTGTLPFSGSDLPHLLSLHLYDPVEPMARRAPNASVPPALDAVVLSALEKDPRARPPTVRDFGRRLLAALVDDRPPEEPVDVLVLAEETEIVEPPRRGLARKAASVVLVLAAAMASFAVVRLGTHRANPSPRTEDARRIEPRAPVSGIDPRGRAPKPLPTAPTVERAHESATPEPASWKVVLGDAVVDRAHEKTPPAAQSGSRPRGSTKIEPAESKAPTKLEPADSKPPTSAEAATDLKTPVWKSQSRGAQRR
ncbi:MAG TPA: protein kinase, partial [Polyangiaceae bacterium]|nr:protein kinase [Polyangiaceae bacterium]